MLIVSVLYKKKSFNKSCRVGKDGKNNLMNVGMNLFLIVCNNTEVQQKLKVNWMCVPTVRSEFL